MISIDAGVLYAAVNRTSPNFAKARALVEELSRSTEVVITEQTLIALYSAIVRKSPDDATRVIRYLRGNPNWRIVDTQSSRVLMNNIWQPVLARGEDFASIRRRRLVQTLRPNGVTRFYTDEPDAYQAIGFEAAVSI